MPPRGVGGLVVILTSELATESILLSALRCVVVVAGSGPVLCRRMTDLIRQLVLNWMLVVSVFFWPVVIVWAVVSVTRKPPKPRRTPFPVKPEKYDAHLRNDDGRGW